MLYSQVELRIMVGNSERPSDLDTAIFRLNRLWLLPC